MSSIAKLMHEFYPRTHMNTFSQLSVKNSSQIYVSIFGHFLLLRVGLVWNSSSLMKENKIRTQLNFKVILHSSAELFDFNA
jgi:hypothetical protein